jgi:prepilin-type N-terminal cleavage/methylation domain-containing protein
MMMRNHQRGFTLLELLIALGLLATLFLIASNGIVSALRVQRLQQDTVSSQAKLRRVVEVFSQDLRSAVLGGITSQPYASSDTSISFNLLAGGAGYPVTGGNVTAGNLTLFASVASATALGLIGNQVMVVNDQGAGMILSITNATAQGGNLYQLTFAPCSNTTFSINTTPPPSGSTFTNANNVLLKVSTVGISFNSANKTLEQRTGTSTTTVPVAFGIQSFNIDYIYEPSSGSSGATQIRDTPILDATNTFPLKTTTIGASKYELERIKVTMSAKEGSGPTRSYSSQIDLSTNNATNSSVFLRSIVPCN